MIRQMTHSEFCDYLDQLAVDYDASGSNATAADYREAVRRIDELVDMVLDMADIVMTLKEKVK